MGRKKGAPLTEKELAQRRAASKKSTGPVTEKGKAIVAMNSWKNGLTAKSVRAKIVGKPCRSTCHKYGECPFVQMGKTTAGGKCLDILVWDVIEETGDAIRAAQQGNMDPMQNIAAVEIGMKNALLHKLFEDVQETGIWVVQDIINKDGEVVGQKKTQNPNIMTYLKMTDSVGFTLPEFLATPQSQAKLRVDDETQKTAADFTREISRLVPKVMQIPAFDESEITEAEVIPAVRSAEGSDEPS